MKFATAILSRLAKGKSETPDVFDLRLANLGRQATRTSRSRLPMLFHRAARAAM